MEIDMSEQLTPGQEQLRTIIRSYLPAEHACQSDTERKEVYSKARDDVMKDSVVRNDPVTGSRLGFFTIADSYVDWIAHGGHRTVYTEMPVSLSLRKFVYDYGGQQQHHQWYAYDGGAKPHVVYQALFTLARAELIPHRQIDLTYYENDAIVLSSGNHRILGYALWGAPFVWATTLTVIAQRRSNPDLNAALLTLEQDLFPYSPGMITWETYSEAEATDVITAVITLSDAQRGLVARFLKEIRAQTLTPENLI